jgi:hypothetical protein
MSTPSVFSTLDNAAINQLISLYTQQPVDHCAIGRTRGIIGLRHLDSQYHLW